MYHIHATARNYGVLTVSKIGCHISNRFISNGVLISQRVINLCVNCEVKSAQNFLPQRVHGLEGALM